MPQDPYQVLGVQPGASEDDIRQAYRRLAKQYHPDLNPGDETAARKMNEINQAYDQLKNPQAYYQQQRQQQAQQQARQAYEQQESDFYDPFGFWTHSEQDQQSQQSYRWTYSYDSEDQEPQSNYQWHFYRPRGILWRLLIGYLLFNLLINILGSCAVRVYPGRYYPYAYSSYSYSEPYQSAPAFDAGQAAGSSQNGKWS